MWPEPEAPEGACWHGELLRSRRGRAARGSAGMLAGCEAKAGWWDVKCKGANRPAACAKVQKWETRLGWRVAVRASHPWPAAVKQGCSPYPEA